MERLVLFSSPLLHDRSCMGVSDPTGGKDKLIVRQFIVKRLDRMNTSLILLLLRMARWPELQRPISLAMVVDPLSKIEEKPFAPWLDRRQAPRWAPTVVVLSLTVE